MPNTSDLSARLEQVASTLSTAMEEAAHLASEMSRARTAVYNHPEERHVSQNLRDAVRVALTRQSLSVAQLARVIGEPAGRVASLIKMLHADNKVHNVGTADSPMWSWCPGDTVEASTLNAIVRRLISERPMTTRELIQATGARPSRISGALVSLQRGSDKIIDLGSPRMGRWFIVTGGRNAHLDQKS
jgi:hypothetical protein